MSWEDGKTTPKKEARFGILTTPSNIRTGFQNTYVATSPKVTWNASSSKKPAKVSLEFYAACLDGASLAQIANRETFQQSWSGVHHFEVMVSKGQGNLRGNLRKQSDSYVYSPDKGDLIEFSIVDEKGKYRISKYLLNAPPLHLWNAYGSTDFSLDAFLVDERPSGGIAAHDRTFDFNIDGRHSQISVKPSPLSMHRKIGSCHALGNRAPAVDGRKDFYTEEAQFGVVVKIEPENQDSVYLVKEHDSAIMKTDGVLWTGELSAAEVARSITDGRVGALVINDGLDKISANGTDHRVEANEMIFLARSNVYLSSADGRLLNGAGTVGVLFKGQERLIRTRWELFGDLVKSSILAALTSLLLSAGLLARSLLSKNEDLYWTSL
ncbi:MAG TPA: hypothetical protein VG821_12530 [Rhizomicrobium sp.]|nr:hypothetical protein [Rhizomicrobium sp.]